MVVSEEGVFPERKFKYLDLRDQEAADKAGYSPGQYLLLFNITAEQAEDRKLLPELYPQLVVEMFKSGNFGEQIRGWEFNPVVHDPERNILLVRAVPAMRESGGSPLEATTVHSG